MKLRLPFSRWSPLTILSLFLFCCSCDVSNAPETRARKLADELCDCIGNINVSEQTPLEQIGPVTKEFEGCFNKVVEQLEAMEAEYKDSPADWSDFQLTYQDATSECVNKVQDHLRRMQESAVKLESAVEDSVAAEEAEEPGS